MTENSSGGGASGIGKWLFIGLSLILVAYFAWPMITGKSKAPERQPLTTQDWGTTAEGERPAEQTCELTGPRSHVVLTSRGGSVKSARMLDPKYAESVDKPDTRIELVTTSREQRMPLRTSLRATGEAAQQVDFDNLDFELKESTPTSCTFVHKDAAAEVTKVVSLTDRPFELDVKLTLKNLASEARTHRYAIEQTSWRSKSETESSFWDLGRRPAWLTDVTTHTAKGTKRHLPGAFDPDDFDPEEGFTKEHFLRAEGDGIWSAVSSNYFVSSVIHQPVEGVGAPAAETLIEEGEYYKLAHGAPDYGHMYRARLAYPEKELASGESVTYDNLAYFGPKERAVLAAVGGADSGRINMTEAIDLGMFGFVGKYLVMYVAWLFKLVGSWGWAICLLTISMKILVFPLMLPSLKTQIATRRLKPQIEAIQAKYKDDMMQKNLAMQELYRKEGIRPMLGCLPMMLQMPVWFALYQALGTAVELFHTPFLMPLIPDLTHADPYHVIPIVLGGSSFLQQKLMPAQGMDPQQQKMMLYMMPGIFTAMMFFLPAGLGVYMVTNTWVGILQQFLVERWIGSQVKVPEGIKVREIKKRESDAPPALGKGKARARG
ncbi:MAG: membrane protein insertase YidC [Polyangiaceae bacterium]|nr:membrane protein insertase YidC [Polyangiaceae bacterium]